jgi:hypothetical protein
MAAGLIVLYKVTKHYGAQIQEIPALWLINFWVGALKVNIFVFTYSLNVPFFIYLWFI